MTADLVIASLLRIAMADLAGARVLAASENRNAIYLLEQAAEKTIRAVLTHAGIHAGISHHLDEMVAKLPEMNALKTALRRVEHLGAYATSYRYPTSTGRIRDMPSRQVFDDSAVTVDEVLRQVASALRVELTPPPTT